MHPRPTLKYQNSLKKGKSSTKHKIAKFLDEGQFLYLEDARHKMTWTAWFSFFGSPCHTEKVFDYSRLQRETYRSQ